MRIRSLLLAVALAFGPLLLLGGPTAAGAAEPNPCASNPCAAKPANPCAANPCASNPCAGEPANPCASNPCAGRPTHPCAGKPSNPCAAAGLDAARIRQPAGVKLAGGDPDVLRARGEQLWNDSGLGRSGLACASCHAATGASITQMQATFAEPFPHRVAMAADAGLSEVNAAEMIQLCMVVPMGSEPLPWSSTELAALEAHVLRLQQDFEPSSAPAHPSAAGAHPCNPCTPGRANPCRNPCVPR